MRTTSPDKEKNTYRSLRLFHKRLYYVGCNVEASGENRFIPTSISIRFEIARKNIKNIE